jgi:hypothetical protein
LLSI